MAYQMNERAQISKIIINVIEEFPEIREFLIREMPGTRSQHFLITIADRLLVDNVVICPLCRSRSSEKIAGTIVGFRENILTDTMTRLKTELDEALEEKRELLEILERVGKWYKANGVRYVIAEDVWAILHKYTGEING